MFLQKHNENHLNIVEHRTLVVILLCLWERHFTALSPAWWFWQAALNFNPIPIKFQADSNILVSPEAGRIITCLMYWHLRPFPASRRINIEIIKIK